MTKKEMKLKLALELQELKELHWELSEDIREAKKEGDKETETRYRRWSGKTHARISQTLKIAEMFGIKGQDLENMAFDLSVEQASKQA